LMGEGRVGVKKIEACRRMKWGLEKIPRLPIGDEKKKPPE